MGWVKLVVGVGVAAYSYRSVTHVNSLVRQIAVPKYSLLAKHTQAGMRTDRQALNNIHKCPPSIGHFCKDQMCQCRSTPLIMFSSISNLKNRLLLCLLSSEQRTWLSALGRGDAMGGLGWKGGYGGFLF